MTGQVSQMCECQHFRWRHEGKGMDGPCPFCVECKRFTRDTTREPECPQLAKSR